MPNSERRQGGFRAVDQRSLPIADTRLGGCLAEDLVPGLAQPVHYNAMPCGRLAHAFDLRLGHHPYLGLGQGQHLTLGILGSPLDGCIELFEARPTQSPRPLGLEHDQGHVIGLRDHGGCPEQREAAKQGHTTGPSYQFHDHSFLQVGRVQISPR